MEVWRVSRHHLDLGNQTLVVYIWGSTLWKSSRGLHSGGLENLGPPISDLGNQTLDTSGV